MDKQDNAAANAPKSFEEEVALYQPKADAGEVSAMFNLGLAYSG